MTIRENHPFSALTRQIEQMLWASIILSCAVAAISLVNMGRLSLFMAPILFVVTTTHHGVILGLLSRDRKRDQEHLKGTLAPTAQKATIIILWILPALWCIAVLTVCIVSVLIMAMNQFEGWERFAGYLELPFMVAEIALLIVLAIKCRKQRKRTMTDPVVSDWQSYQSTTVV